MKNNVSVACLTADLLGGRSFSINYHLFTVINAICENISISSIHLYTTSINDFSSGSLQEIQADFHIHFPFLIKIKTFYELKLFNHLPKLSAVRKVLETLLFLALGSFETLGSKLSHGTS